MTSPSTQPCDNQNSFLINTVLSTTGRFAAATFFDGRKLFLFAGWLVVIALPAIILPLAVVMVRSRRLDMFFRVAEAKEYIQS